MPSFYIYYKCNFNNIIANLTEKWAKMAKYPLHPKVLAKCSLF